MLEIIPVPHDNKPLLGRNKNNYVQLPKSFPLTTVPYFQWNTLQGVFQVYKITVILAQLLYPPTYSHLWFTFCAMTHIRVSHLAHQVSISRAGPLCLDVIMAPQEQHVQTKFTDDPYPLTSFPP